MSDKGPPQQSEVKPNPDPSVLTTEQLLREIDRVVKLLEAKIEGQADVVTTRFLGVDREFALIEERRKEQKSDTEKALVNALSAAKEAVKEQNAASEKSNTKTETSAAEQSRQQFTTFTATIKGITDSLADVKDRVNRMEAAKVGSSEFRGEQRLDMGTILAILSLAAVVVFALIR